MKEQVALLTAFFGLCVLDCGVLAFPSLHGWLQGCVEVTGLWLHLDCFRRAGAVWPDFLPLASVCLWTCSERWLMGTANTCLLTESSSCFLKCFWLNELFVLCPQTTCGLRACCCEHLMPSRRSRAYKATSTYDKAGLEELSLSENLN